MGSQSHASEHSKTGDDSLTSKVMATKQGTDLVNKMGTIEVLGFLPGIGPYVGGNSSSSDSDSDDEGSLMKCFTKKHFTQKQMLKMMRKGSWLAVDLLLVLLVWRLPSGIDRNDDSDNVELLAIMLE